MPMSFPDFKSLRARASVRGFRQPRDNETEPQFREAFANFMRDVDIVESMEIRSGLGWDQQDPAALLMGIWANGDKPSLDAEPEPEAIEEKTFEQYDAELKACLEKYKAGEMNYSEVAKTIEQIKEDSLFYISDGGLVQSALAVKRIAVIDVRDLNYAGLKVARNKAEFTASIRQAVHVNDDFIQRWDFTYVLDSDGTYKRASYEERAHTARYMRIEKYAEYIQGAIEAIPIMCSPDLSKRRKHLRAQLQEVNAVIEVWAAAS